MIDPTEWVVRTQLTPSKNTEFDIRVIRVERLKEIIEVINCRRHQLFDLLSEKYKGNEVEDDVGYLFDALDENQDETFAFCFENEKK